VAGVESRGKPRTPAEGLRLVKASLEAPAGLLEFIREIDEGENGFGGEPAVIAGPLAAASDVVAGQTAVEAFLRSLVEMSEGRNLPEGWVPMTTFWLVGAGAVVAMSNLRRRLNDFLLNHGGHIGYYVAREQRRKGYATQMLALTLAEARKLGIERALLTVDSDNEPSIRVIERNGGVLEDEGIDSTTGKLHRRYWIELT
jgi:predicted acetyltransferase